MTDSLRACMIASSRASVLWFGVKKNSAAAILRHRVGREVYPKINYVRSGEHFHFCTSKNILCFPPFTLLFTLHKSFLSKSEKRQKKLAIRVKKEGRKGRSSLLMLFRTGCQPANTHEECLNSQSNLWPLLSGFLSSSSFIHYPANESHL